MARTKGDSDKPSKRALVQSAIEALGDPKAAEVQAYVKEKFGTDLDLGLISTYKSQLNPKRKKRGKKRGRPAGVPNAVAPAAKAPRTSVSIDDIHEIKALINRFGTDGLVSMIKVLS